MKTKTKFLMSLLLVLALTITSCSKEGDIGPAGPAGTNGIDGMDGVDGEALGAPGPKGDTGDTGADGEDGADGTDGTDGQDGEDGADGQDGEDGSVNILYSQWLDQDLSHQNFQKFKQMRVQEPRLTNAFLNEGGIVLGFFRYTTNAIHNMPYLDAQRANVRYMLIGSEDGGHIEFTIEPTDGTDLDTQDVDGVNPSFNPQYKYVLIPGGTPLSGKSTTNFKKMSYHEVMNHFGLPY